MKDRVKEKTEVKQEQENIPKKLYDSKQKQNKELLEQVQRRLDMEVVSDKDGTVVTVSRAIQV